MIIADHVICCSQHFTGFHNSKVKVSQPGHERPENNNSHLCVRMYRLMTILVAILGTDSLTKRFAVSFYWSAHAKSVKIPGKPVQLPKL